MVSLLSCNDCAGTEAIQLLSRLPAICAGGTIKSNVDFNHIEYQNG